MIHGRTPIPSPLGIWDTSAENVRFIHMWVPQVTRHSPLPSGILGKDILRYEALVLDDQRNSDQVRKKPLVDQADFEIINQNERRSDPGVSIRASDAHGVVVIPHEPRAL